MQECWRVYSGITDYFKLNLFHFKDELVAADWPVYTSTFGNINTYNAYVALVIGCCGALFIDAETKKEKYGILSAI